MMSSRVKKIMQLVPDEVPDVRNNTKDENVYNFDNEVDKWADYKKWKNEQESKETSNIENVQECEAAELESQLSSSVEGETSDSWVPSSDENNEFKNRNFLGDLLHSISQSSRDSDIELETMETVSEEEQKALQLGAQSTKNINIISDVLIPITESKNQKLHTSAETNKDMSRTNRVTNRPIARLPIDTVNLEHQVEVSHRKGRVWDKKDRCIFCNRDVTNFSRHLFRKHSDEKEVLKILSIPKKNAQRKLFLDLLRKEGNLKIFSENIIRPVQRPTPLMADAGDLTFLPCKFCKGLYKKKSLNRHVKNCKLNTEILKNRHLSYTSEGQTLLAFTESRKKYLNRLRLKTEVFNTMHADRISMISKSDPLICQYAEDFLKKHKRPHIKNLVSNKLRELGRLLMCLKDNYGINSMFDALNPESFDIVVSAARIISGYNESTKSFEAPSLALHFRTILIAVCSTATTLLLKKDPIIPIADSISKLKMVEQFCQLVQHNWKFEMGSLALKDLNEKHSQKPQTLPLTEDILTFNKFCHKVAEETSSKLKIDMNDVQSFKKLSESILTLTISLNRKRVGDVQYIKLESYTSASNSTDCLNILTESEQNLAKYFKRIITVGKGSKPVPVLFPKKIQEYIDLMLNFRNTTSFVPKENPYLFAQIGSSSKWIDGPSVLRKFATSSGVKHPETITSSRLRKQIATVLQILSLSEVEMEQLASFMGHTKKTHEEFYRLPQELFQTSKIAKLLLMMSGDDVNKNQGKTIDEIDIELHAWEDNISSQEPEEIQPTVLTPEPELEPTEETRIESHSGINKRDGQQLEEEKKITGLRGTWNIEQKRVVFCHFNKFIKMKKAPKKNDCLECRKKFPVLLSDKTWLQIKTLVYNTYRNS